MADIFNKLIHLSLVAFALHLCCFAHAQTESGKNLVITDKTWEQMLVGEWMLKFYAPWCPACRAMEETWDKLASWASLNGPAQIKVGSIDVTAQVALNGRFMITKLPTIYHVINGEFRQYSANRELEDFISFIGNDEWKEISPVSSWTSPTSFIMSSMSKLFSFSMELKSYHSYLSTSHGFPQWLSMLLFGVLIILIGLLLGVVFVLASDYFWGTPQYYEEDIAIAHKKDDDTIVMDDVDSNSVVEETSSQELEKEVSQKNDDEGEIDPETGSSSTVNNLRQRKLNE